MYPPLDYPMRSPRNRLKYKLQLISCLALLLIASCNGIEESKDPELLDRTKRNLLAKEKEYLKHKPLSEEMRTFIKRFRRKAQKRERTVDEDKMYVVQNGEIVPFNNLERGMDTDDEKHEGTVSNFTVIPLIIPVSVPRDETEPTTNDMPLFRNRFQQHEECEPDRSDPPETKEGDAASGGRGGLSTIKSVDTKLLSKVMQDLQKLTDAENEAKLRGESTSCRVEGDWDSNAGGMQIRMEFRNDTHHPDAKLVDRDPPMEEGFLSGKNWSISALVPFTKASCVVLNLYTTRGKRVIGIFAGECRICDGEETIAGSWIIQRHSKDCKDRHLSQKFISDVLKKNNVRELQQQNLREMEGTSTQGTR